MRLFLTSSGTVSRARLRAYERSYGYGVSMSSRMRSCEWIGTVFIPSTQVLHSQSALKVGSSREKYSIRTLPVFLSPDTPHLTTERREGWTIQMKQTRGSDAL